MKQTNIGEIVRNNAGKVALAAFIAGSAAGYEFKTHQAELGKAISQAPVYVADLVIQNFRNFYESH